MRGVPGPVAYMVCPARFRAVCVGEAATASHAINVINPPIVIPAAIQRPSV